MQQTKYCHNCNTIKYVTEFDKKTKAKNGYNPKCKECIKIKNKKVYNNRVLGQLIIDEIENEILKDYESENKINEHLDKYFTGDEETRLERFKSLKKYGTWFPPNHCFTISKIDQFGDPKY